MADFDSESGLDLLDQVPWQVSEEFLPEPVRDVHHPPIVRDHVEVIAQFGVVAGAALDCCNFAAEPGFAECFECVVNRREAGTGARRLDHLVEFFGCGVRVG